MSRVNKIRPILARLYYQHNPKFTVRQGRILIDLAIESIAEIIEAEKKKVKSPDREPYHYGWDECCNHIVKMIRGNRGKRRGDEQ